MRSNIVISVGVKFVCVKNAGMEKFMKIVYDTPTYPEFGNVYKGDYYENIPVEEYIKKDGLIPTGKNVFDIRDFGAVAEENRLNTEAFHNAAKACEKVGGGIILVEDGVYRMGSIWLPSNTTLYIAPNATLEASRDVYQLIDKDLFNEDSKYGSESTEGAFLHVHGKTNIKITGGGKISGSGEWYVYEPKELPALFPFSTTKLPRRDQSLKINEIPDTIRYYYRQRIRYAEDKYQEGKENLKRPSYMVWIDKSDHIVIENIILHDSMTWTLNVECCDDVVIRDIIIDDNRHVANTDGIDIVGSSNVTVDHCFISCADDGICLKNPSDTERTMENIYIKNCTVLSVMSAFKIGTGTRHDISNVYLEDCLFCLPDIYPGSVTGISIESCDGTNLSNVFIKNIKMENVACPLYILLNMRNQAKVPCSNEVQDNAYWGGTIKNIQIENISAIDAEVPSIITGFETYKKDKTIVRKPVENVIVRNMTVQYRKNEEIIEVPEHIEEFLVDYPESNAHGDVSACGIWVRHVDGIQLKNIDIIPRETNIRKKIVLDDVQGANLL